jgi:hypothetical protein
MIVLAVSRVEESMQTVRSFRSLLALTVALMSTGVPSNTCAQNSSGLCSCGPDYCLNDPRFPLKLNAKKQRLRKAGFSANLIALLDGDGACVAAVDNGPDTFFIKTQIRGGWDTRELNVEREGYAKSDLLSGKTDAYYEFNTNRAQDCCGQPKYNQRDDYDSSLDLNLRLATVCRKSGSGVSCKNAK